MDIAAEIENLVAKNVAEGVAPEDEYEKAMADFDGLVEKGLLKPRGFTLQTIEDRLRDASGGRLARASIGRR